jgi:O-antigen ligase
MTDPLTLLLGIGPYNEARISSITGAWGAHNEILDVALKLGIAGLTLWIMIIVALVKRLNSVRLVHHSLGKYRSTMLSILAANVAASFTQSHLLQGYATYTACIFLLWLYSVSASPRPDSKAQTPIAGDRHLPSQFS